jgi:hypothetical protein
MDNKTHPFQVAHWLPEEPALRIFGDAHWVEDCRCTTRQRAERIAQVLCHDSRLCYVVREAHEGVWQAIAWYPGHETVALNVTTSERQH